MHRLLVDAETLNEERAVLGKDAARHLKVVRPRDGEEFELFDGVGSSRIYRYRVARANGAERSESGLWAAGSRDRRPVRSETVTLFACITKGSRWDWTVEKATELGVARIVPVLSGRTVVRIPEKERAAKRERWRKIAEEAARQSSALWLPEIAEPVEFGRALELAGETVCFAGALVEPRPAPLLAAVEAAFAGGRTPGNLSLFVGPEGDFTPEELAALLKVAVPASFGDLVLRAETAAIFGLTVLTAALDAARVRRSGICAPNA